MGSFNVVKPQSSKERHMMGVVAIALVVIGAMYPMLSSAQSGAVGPESAIISGAFQVASEGGTLRGDPPLSSGSLSFGIPSPAGVGLFDTERLTTPGPFGHGTVLFPTATSTSVDFGSMILNFSNGGSSFKDFGDRRTLTTGRQGLVLLDPNRGTTFFGQKTANNRYAISRIVGLDKNVVAQFSYGTGASVPSSISINGGERKISIEQNASGNITRISVDGMVATYSYVLRGTSNLLAEVKVDGNSVLKLTWEEGLPTSARNAYGEVEMYAFIRKWDDTRKFALAGVVGRDGTVSTIQYTAKDTTVRVDGVPYKYEWAKNPVLGNTYPRAVSRAGRLLGTTKVDPFTGRVISEEDEFGSATSYSWDAQPSAVPRKITLPDGTIITNTVNSNDDVTTTTRKSPGGFTTTYSYVYDQARRLVRYEVKNSVGDSSATTSYTYSGVRTVPDAIASKEISTVRFSTRGRVESISRQGETFGVSANDGGKRLVFNSSGIATNVTRGASSSGVYSLSITSPLVKVTSKSDPLGGSDSYEVLRLGRSAGGANGPALASLSTSGLMTSAYAADTGGSWLPYVRRDSSRSGTSGNYTYDSTTVSADGTRREKMSAKRQGDGSCDMSNSCSAKPTGVEENTPSPTPTATATPRPTTQASATATPSPFPSARPTVQPTSTPTRTPTPQPTSPPANTFTPTRTPTPQPTSPPANTFTPTPTPGIGICCPVGDARCCTRNFPGSKCRVCIDAPVV